MDTAICFMPRTILTIRLLRRACVDTRALVDRLNAIHDNTVPDIDPGFDHDICSNGLSELYLFLEGAQLWRFHGISAFCRVTGFFAFCITGAGAAATAGP